MLITVPGSTTSDSYLTLEEANAFLDSSGLLTSSWSGLSDSIGDPEIADGIKEYLLKVATQLIGYFPLAGHRVYLNQSLDFPRSIQTEVNIIPPPVMEAEALLACLVVLPNFLKQPSLSDTLALPTSLQNLAVNKVNVAGIMTVNAGAASSSSVSGSGNVSSATGVVDKWANLFVMPVYMRMKPFLSQIRGGSLQSPCKDVRNLLPEIVI